MSDGDIDPYMPDSSEFGNESGVEDRREERDAFPTGFEENHQLRSDFIRLITVRQINSYTRPSARSVSLAAPMPRTLVRYWHDASAVPPDVRSCLATWDVLRDEDISFRMFDRTSAAQYIAQRYGTREIDAFERCSHPAMQSDYLRMCVILADGGVYADADDALVGVGWRSLYRNGALKVQALCYDLAARAMVPESELRQPTLSTANRVFYVNNNPMAAGPDHPVIRAALDRATSRLLRDDLESDIQATTGPGNLTAALAAHARALQYAGAPPDFELLVNWDETARPRWDLEYRNDDRNWRRVFPN